MWIQENTTEEVVIENNNIETNDKTLDNNNEVIWSEVNNENVVDEIIPQPDLDFSFLFEEEKTDDVKSEEKNEEDVNLFSWNKEEIDKSNFNVSEEIKKLEELIDKKDAEINNSKSQAEIAEAEKLRIEEELEITRNKFKEADELNQYSAEKWESLLKHDQLWNFVKDFLEWKEINLPNIVKEYLDEKIKSLPNTQDISQEPVVLKTIWSTQEMINAWKKKNIIKIY
jgi:hypothetical protein